ncbi:MAG: glycosyltransferase family 2 protein [Bryobacteraceae bacterium]
MVQLLFNGLDRIRGWNVDSTTAFVMVGIYAFVLTLLLVRARRNFLALPELAVRPAQATPPDCMVVIPARNEAGFIGRAVKSLPPDSVIVVDDHSTDTTVAEAAAAGAGVLRSPKLTKGVFGKPYACMTGARVITSKWILFADADTWYEPGILESAIHAAEVNDLSFLSIHLALETEGLAERAVAPLLQALFFASLHPRERPEGVFYGQCVLVRRTAHEFIGGFGAGLTFLVDDVKLALLADRHRMRFGTARTSTLGHARSHRGWEGLNEGVRRNAYRFVLIPGQHSVMLLATAMVLALWLPFAILLILTGWVPLAIGIAVLPVLLLFPWYGMAGVALAPAAPYIAIPILFNALFGVLTTTHVDWKDREV